MKKLTTLMLAAGLVFAASAPASAVDVKFDGTYLFQFTQGAGAKFDDSKFDKEMQMVRLGMTFAASENLSGYAQLHAKWDWGNSNQDLENGKPGLGSYNDLYLRQAYIDWVVPATPVKVRMGRQLLALPHMAMGKNAALWWSDPADGIAVSAPVTDWLGLSAWWARYDRNNGYDTAVSDELDVFAAIADVKFDGIRVQPYVAFAAQGEGTEPTNPSNRQGYFAEKNNTLWAGASATVTMFDPFTFKFSATYGNRDFTEDDKASQKGWFADAVVEYKTAYGTPSLSAFYGTGDSDDAQYAYQDSMPTMGGRFKGSYGFFNGMLCEDNNLQNGHTGTGAWGVRAAVSKISFLEDLSHEIAVVYAQGTNDKAGAEFGKTPWAYMTEEDSIVEFDFGSTYKIYKNLTAILEMAYVLEDFDTKLANRADKYEDAWKVALQFSYDF